MTCFVYKFTVTLFRLQNAEVSVFEFNIRYLGGLLSAYSLTGDMVGLFLHSNVLYSYTTLGLFIAGRYMSLMYSKPPSLSPIYLKCWPVSSFVLSNQLSEVGAKNDGR